LITVDRLTYLTQLIGVEREFPEAIAARHQTLLTRRKIGCQRRASACPFGREQLIE
jgi:hypothetical protein